MKELLNYFEPVFADDEVLKAQAFKTRHEIYSERLGWESVTETGLEYDGYDEFAYHCLLRHKRTGIFIGTARLIIIDQDSLLDHVPAERFAGEKLLPEKVKYNGLARPKSEISRITIFPDWHQRIPDLSEEELSLGRYLILLMLLPMIHIITGFEQTSTLGIMEKKFIRRLKLLGFDCEVISGPVEHRGTRLAIQILAHQVLRDMRSEVFELYAEIRKKVEYHLDARGVPGELGRLIREDISKNPDKQVTRIKLNRE